MTITLPSLNYDRLQEHMVQRTKDVDFVTSYIGFRSFSLQKLNYYKSYFQ